MGQTLTHGVYLPDEGERNCYSGLAGNWTILDGAVGTVAEHTSALAGKAPAVHTHVKAGITDLLNSDFIPSANNSYNLGSSNYQWKSVYAQSYYYNGTEFQDKFVTLDSTQTITYSKTFGSGAFLEVHGYRFRVINDDMEVGVVPTSNQWTGMLFTDKNKTNISEIVQSFQSNGHTLWQVIVRPNEANAQRKIILGYAYNSANNINRFSVDSDFVPVTSNTYNLGISNQKWKTLNGINPGALGIPSGVRQSILEYITDVNLSGNNQVTAVRDGYIVVTITDAAGNSIYLYNNTKQYSNGSYGNGSQGTGRLTCMLPVNEGDVIYIFIKAAALSDVFSAYLYVMNGNVNALPSS